MSTRLHVWWHPQRSAAMDNSYRIIQRAVIAAVNPTVRQVSRKIFFPTRRVACFAMQIDGMRGTPHITLMPISTPIRHQADRRIRLTTRGPTQPQIPTRTHATACGGICVPARHSTRVFMPSVTSTSAERVTRRHVEHRSGRAMRLPVRAHAAHRTRVCTYLAAPHHMLIAITAAIFRPVARPTWYKM